MALNIELTSGSIPGHFRRLAIPTAIGMVFTTLYNVVDMFYAGLISTDAQAGLAISFQVFFVIMALGFGLSSAMSALVGNAIGAGESVRAGKTACQGLGYGLIAAVLLGLGGYWFAPFMLGVISEPGVYRDAANAYIIVLLFATPGFLIAFGANGILTAQGDTVSMQRGQMVAFFANLVLNPLFIFGVPGLIQGFGFDGIALSTLVSQTGVMLWIVYRVAKSRVMAGCAANMFRPQLAGYREITGQAMPASFAVVVMMFGGFIIQFYLKDFGRNAVAAYGVALRIEQILLLPGFGLTGALLPIVAQNYGAKDFTRVRQALFYCFRAGLLLMLLASMILWFAGAPAMRLFTAAPEVVRIGSEYLLVDGFILPVYILLFAMNSFLQAVKRPIWSVWIGLYRQVFGIAFFGYLFVRLLDWGTWGVWFGIMVSVFTGFILSSLITYRVAGNLIGGLRRR